MPPQATIFSVPLQRVVGDPRCVRFIRGYIELRIVASESTPSIYLR